MRRWQKSVYGQAKEDQEIAKAKMARFRRWDVEGRSRICPACGGGLDVCYSCPKCGEIKNE